MTIERNSNFTTIYFNSYRDMLEFKTKFKDTLNNLYDNYINVATSYSNFIRLIK